MKALSRSLAGMRSSGNDGKISPVGPNGTGNLGKTSPTPDNGVGNVGTNGMYGNYYALTTDMTLEEYEKYVQTIFEGDDCECEHEKEDKKKKPTGRAFQRLKYNRRFVNVVVGPGAKRGPNARPVS